MTGSPTQAAPSAAGSGRLSRTLVCAAGVLNGAPPPDGGEATWLRWDAPGGCPNANAVAQAIAGRLGGPPAADGLVVDAGVTDEGAAGYRLALITTIDGHTERRQLVAQACGALADAVALLVALSVDPVAVVQTLGVQRAYRSPVPNPRDPDPTQPEPGPPPRAAGPDAPSLSPALGRTARVGPARSDRESGRSLQVGPRSVRCRVWRARPRSA